MIRFVAVTAVRDHHEVLLSGDYRLYVRFYDGTWHNVSVELQRALEAEFQKLSDKRTEYEKIMQRDEGIASSYAYESGRLAMRLRLGENHNCFVSEKLRAAWQRGYTYEGGSVVQKRSGEDVISCSGMTFRWNTVYKAYVSRKNYCILRKKHLVGEKTK